MITSHLPFTKAHPKDSFYKLIGGGRVDKYWEIMTKDEPKEFLSDKFKDLFIKMVQVDPTKRLTLEEAKHHPWMRGAVLKQEDVYKEFLERKKMINKKVKETKEK